MFLFVIPIIVIMLLACMATHSMQDKLNKPWIILGYFNLVKNNAACMSDFNSTLNQCGLSDLGFVGNIFTWTNKLSGSDHIMERLDIFSANQNWIIKFPKFPSKKSFLLITIFPDVDLAIIPYCLSFGITMNVGSG